MPGSDVARWFAKIVESTRSPSAGSGQALDLGLSRKLDARSLGMTGAICIADDKRNHGGR